MHTHVEAVLSSQNLLSNYNGSRVNRGKNQDHPRSVSITVACMFAYTFQLDHLTVCNSGSQQLSKGSQYYQPKSSNDSEISILTIKMGHAGDFCRCHICNGFSAAQ